MTLKLPQQKFPEHWAKAEHLFLNSRYPQHIEIPLLNWTDYFLGLAFLIKEKSKDAQTKHGCVITDQQHRILGVGYNGFPRSVDDKLIPNIRPEKYDYVIHSEVNAVLNCSHRPENGIAYVTGQCCNECFKVMHQAGIKTLYMIEDDYGSAKLNDDTTRIFCKLVYDTGMDVYYVKPDLYWLKTAVEKIV